MQKIVAEDWELDPGFRERLAAWDVFLESFDGLLPGGVGIFNFDGGHIRPLYVSESAVLLCEGIEPELRGEARENVACLLPEEDQKKLRECAQTARRNSKILDCVIRYYTSKNKKGWMWVRGRVMNEYRDRLVYMMVLLDVTAQKEMENELRIQNERYLLLEETSNEILFELKLNDDVLTYSYRELNGELNRRRISHYSRLMRENPLVHPEHRDMFREQLLAASRGAVQNQMEYLSRISGNGYEWHRVYYKSVEDESGNVLRIIGRIRNIHDEVLKRQRGLQHYHVAGAESAIQRKVRECLEDADLEDSHAVVILSVYSFKKMVEERGVACGDAVTRFILSLFRGGVFDLTGPLGDGKFLLYAKNIAKDDLEHTVTGMIRLAESPGAAADGLTLCCNAGAAVADGAVDFDMIFQEAEAALDDAKLMKGASYVCSCVEGEE